jgi:WD40 repeat protein
VRALRVFRDTTSLAATPSLWPSIEEALADSEFLILLASPEAAQSEWIAREVEYWREHKPPDRILIALTGGEMTWDDAGGDFAWEQTSALPPCLREAFTTEPLYVDLRWARTTEQLSHRHPDFRRAVAGLAAPLHGCGKEEIFSEDIRQHRRTMRLARGAIAVLATLAALATTLAVVAQHRGNEARVARDRAEAQSQVATSHNLAAQGAIRFRTDPQLSLLLSVAAFRTHDDADTRSALARQAADRHGLRGIISCDNDLASAVAFSANGRMVACGGLADVGFWDARTYKKLRSTEWLPTSSIAFSRGGTYLAIASFPLTVTNLRTGRNVPLKGPDDSANVVAFDPADARTLATGGTDGRVRAWDLSTRTHRTLTRRRGKVTGVAFSSNGRTLAASSADGTIAVWGSSAGASPRLRTIPRLTLAGKAGSVNGVAVSPDGETVAATGDRGRVILWDAGTGRRRKALRVHSGVVTSVAFSPDGRTLASGGADGTVVLWNRSTGSRTTMTGHTNSVTALAFSPDGQILASAGDDDRVFLWDAHPTPFVLRGHTAHVRTVAFSPTGTMLASGDDDGAVIIWDSRTGRRRATLRGHGQRIQAVAFSPDGRILASAAGSRHMIASDLPGCPSVDAGRPPMQRLIADAPGDATTAEPRSPNAVILWNARTGRRLATLVGHRESVNAVAFSPDGSIIASGSDDGTVILWNARTGRRSATLTAHDPITAVAFNPDGRRLASAGGKQTVVWDVEARRPLVRLKSDSVDGVAFGSKGRTLATAGHGVALWDPRRPHTPIRRLCTGMALGVAFSPDGAKLATAGADGTVGAWDPVHRLVSFADHYRGQVDAVAFSADGHTVASVGADTQVILRDVDTADLPRRLCRMAGRDLTSAERRVFAAGLAGRRLCAAR